MKNKDDKLRLLNKRIEILKDKIHGKKLSKSKVENNTELKKLSIIINVMIEFISGIVVGGFVGYFLDKFFTTNFLFPVFIFLGILVGILNLYRYIRNL